MERSDWLIKKVNEMHRLLIGGNYLGPPLSRAHVNRIG